ncbi:MAG: response regulator [Anaerolineae bacterium]|nr:response regulator [Anaerolineae bacterium]
MSAKHALVIDDNSTNVRILVQMLAKQGISSTEISKSVTLESVLPTLDQVDIVFLDLEMPGLDGFAAKELIRSHLGDIPIVAYTVHISEMNSVQQRGFDGFLPKPLDNTRFPDQVARLLRGEGVWERV